MDKSQIVYLKLHEIKPYENNPRKNKGAVKAVAESLKEFGPRNPIIVDKDMVIITGHTRYLAATELGLTEFPCIIAADMSEQKAKAYRLVDNKTSELSAWDDDKLALEIDGIEDIDLERFGFEIEDAQETENPYTGKTAIPQYEVTGALPRLDELVESLKVGELEQEIEDAPISEDEKVFLKIAAARHYAFNFRKIAEYYANIASPEMQRLMEKSALVIIDIDDAIANGYVRLAGDISDMLKEDEDDEG